MRRETDMMQRAVFEARQRPSVRFADALVGAIEDLGWTLEPPPRFLARPIPSTLDWEVVDTVHDGRIRHFQWVKARESKSDVAVLAKAYAEGVMLGYGERMGGR